MSTIAKQFSIVPSKLEVLNLLCVRNRSYWCSKTIVFRKMINLWFLLERCLKHQCFYHRTFTWSKWYSVIKNTYIFKFYFEIFSEMCRVKKSDASIPHFLLFSGQKYENLLNRLKISWRFRIFFIIT